MAMAMIECPVCSWSQPIPLSAAPDSIANTKRPAVQSKSIESQLPAKYLKWLEETVHGEEVEFAERTWQLANTDELVAQVTIDGHETTYLGQVEAYVNVLAKYAPHLTDVSGREIAFNRLRHYLTLGDDYPELLCTDPDDDYSVWSFLPGEGGLLEQLAGSLADFIDSAQVGSS
jgi:hypothetical protein